MKKKLVTTLLAGALSASMILPAFADDINGAVPHANGTQVWAGIMIEDHDARVMVEVPTLFAFVVNGTIDTDASAVTVDDGTILLPNAKVTVYESSVGTDPSNANKALTAGRYTIDYVGDGNMPFTNYSTYVPTTGAEREGLEVSINGNIVNERDSLYRKHWMHTTSAKTTNDTDDFKNYNVSIDGNAFDTPYNGGLQMENAIVLNAPDLSELDGNSKPKNLADNDLAIIGETHNAVFSVTVGGQRDQYKQVEQSAQVGTIVWTVSAIGIDSEKVHTAPDNEYLNRP